MKFENANVYNMREAIRAARYSYGSERASDTTDDGGVVEIGKNDRVLIERLAKAGASHRKFMRAILLTVDITAPRYWWTQFDTYKVGVTALSESTMHKIMDNPITMSNFAFSRKIRKGDIERHIVSRLEKIRLTGQDCTKDNSAVFNRIISLLPQSYLQKRHVAMNYEAVRNIMAQRRGHKLKEWREFIEWAAALPHSDIFFGGLI